MQVIQIEPIRQTAEDAGLIARIDQLNAEATEHNQRQSVEPPKLERDALLSLAIENIHDTAAGLLSSQLAQYQQTLTLARERLAILEELLPERERSLAEHNQKQNKAIESTRKKLISAGLGPDAQHAAKYGNTLAAERQFDATVIQSQTVQSAMSDRKIAQRELNMLQQEILSAQGIALAAEMRLSEFVNDQFLSKGF